MESPHIGNLKNLKAFFGNVIGFCFLKRNKLLKKYKFCWSSFSLYKVLLNKLVGIILLRQLWLKICFVNNLCC